MNSLERQGISAPTICTRCFIIQDKNLAISYGREKAGI
jgi:hypothetical protein